MTHTRPRLQALAALTAAGTLTGFGLLTPSVAHAAVRAQAAAPTCAGKAATLVGTSGADTLVGTAGRDVIVGGAGDDVIEGLGGNDIICGGDGNDRLEGGEGSDRLLGEAGDDTLRGGRDQITRDSEGNIFRSGDILTGGAGDDSLGAGQDTRRADFVNTPDTVSFTDSPAAVRVDLSKATLTTAGVATGDGTDGVSWAPGLQVVGSAHADTLVGSRGAEVLDGRAGADVIHGGAGNDTLYADQAQTGAADNDRLYGEAGNDDLESYRGRDLLEGGDGNDRAWARYSGFVGPAAAPVTVHGGAGNDDIRIDFGVYAATITGSSVTAGAGRDRVTLSLGRGGDWRIDNVAGTFSATISGKRQTMPFSGAEVFWLSGPKVTFRGSSKNEFVSAPTQLTAQMGGGNDRVVGSSRADRIDGGAGTDTVNGGAGADTCTHVEHRTSC